jgi:hypothetical protein
MPGPTARLPLKPAPHLPSLGISRCLLLGLLQLALLLRLRLGSLLRHRLLLHHHLLHRQPRLLLHHHHLLHHALLLLLLLQSGCRLRLLQRRRLHLLRGHQRVWRRWRRPCSTTLRCIPASAAASHDTLALQSSRAGSGKLGCMPAM